MRSTNEPAPGQHRILVVGDDAEFVRTVELMLAREGFDVACAAGAMQALFVIEARPPDVVICDLRASNASGWALPEALRRQTGRFRGGMIACAAEAGSSQDAFQQAGFDRLVTVPLDAAAVAKAVRSFARNTRGDPPGK